MVEMAAACAVLVALLLMAVDLWRVAWTSTMLQFALSQGLRSTLVVFEPDPIDRRTLIEGEIITVAQRFGFALSAQQVQICQISQPNCQFETAGSSEAFLVATATYSLPVLFDSFSVDVSSRSIVRNEPNTVLADIQFIDEPTT